MTALLIGPLGVPELLIILAVLLLLFGGARLAGIGKSTGRAIKEFKEETRGLREGDKTRDRERDRDDVLDRELDDRPSTTRSEAAYQQPSSGSTAVDPSAGDPRRD